MNGSVIVVFELLKSKAFQLCLYGIIFIVLLTHQLYKMSADQESDSLPKNVLFRWYFVLICLPLIAGIGLSEIDYYLSNHKYLLANHKVIRQAIVFTVRAISVVSFFGFCFGLLFSGKMVELLKKRYSQSPEKPQYVLLSEEEMKRRKQARIILAWFLFFIIAQILLALFELMRGGK